MDDATDCKITAISFKVNEDIVVVTQDGKFSSNVSNIDEKDLAKKCGLMDEESSNQANVTEPCSGQGEVRAINGVTYNATSLGCQQKNVPKTSSIIIEKNVSKTDSVDLSLTTVRDNIVSMRDGKSCLVKVAPVLQIERSKETGICSYRHFIMTVVTASRHHPDHGCPYKTKYVTLTYDCNRQMVVLQVPYIENGMYEVLTKGQTSPHQKFKKASVQQAQLVSHETIDNMPKGSTYVIIKGIYQIPSNIDLKSCRAWKRLLFDFVCGVNFREFTLPLLLAHGEQNVWGDIPGCQDVQPVFLTPKLDYESWKWCQGLDIPEMKPTPRSNSVPDEPLHIPENIKFCEFIYHTYIAGTPWKQDEYGQSEIEMNETTKFSKNTMKAENDRDEPQFKQPSILPKKSLLKVQKAKADKKVSWEKRHTKTTRHGNKRLVLNVHSLCGSSPTETSPDVVD